MQVQIRCFLGQAYSLCLDGQREDLSIVLSTFKMGNFLKLKFHFPNQKIKYGSSLNPGAYKSFPFTCLLLRANLSDSTYRDMLLLLDMLFLPSLESRASARPTACQFAELLIHRILPHVHLWYKINGILCYFKTSQAHKSIALNVCKSIS